MEHPLDSHWNVVKRILRYLKGTLFYGLHFHPASFNSSASLRAFCDVDRAYDVDDKRFTSSVAIFLGPNLVSWWSRKQQVIAQSSTEAEYRSLAQTFVELSWISKLLTKLQVPFCSPVLYCDNHSVVYTAHNPVFHHKTKHMEIDVFFVREKILLKQLQVSHVHALDQWADALTKPLSSSRFIFLRSKLNLKAFSSEKSSS